MAKKQHYVPRLLLRNFSTDIDRKMINIHLVKLNKFILPGSLYEQAQENYLYGADQKLEHMYELLESTTAPAIKKLINGDLELDSEECLHLKLFAMYQLSRTPGNVELYNDTIQSLVRKKASYDSYLKDHLDEFTVGIKDPYMFLFRIATEALYVILDLHIGLLESNVGNHFVLGQNPVIRLNPFLKEKKWMFSTQGLILKGLMIIMPLSPKYSIILYDNYRYKLINKTPKWLISDKDINLLNRLQYLNTNECIYFDFQSDVNYLKQVSQETEIFRNNTKVKLEEYKNEKQTNKKESLLDSGLIEYPIEQKFGFCGIKQYAYLEKITNHTDAIREVMPNFISDRIEHIRNNRYGT